MKLNTFTVIVFFFWRYLLKRATVEHIILWFGHSCYFLGITDSLKKLKKGTTVLSGAEERFAEERPGWNFT